MKQSLLLFSSTLPSSSQLSGKSVANICRPCHTSLPENFQRSQYFPSPKSQMAWKNQFKLEPCKDILLLLRNINKTVCLLT